MLVRAAFIHSLNRCLPCRPPEPMSLEATESSVSTERSLNSQVVLDEDEYTEALSSIIARDFFPSLVQLDATNEYLDALRTRDPHLIGASVRRLEEVSQTPTPGPSRGWLPSQTPSQTPFGLTSDTPLYRDTLLEPPSKRPKYDSNMSLDEFQARYTSEDNSSFTRILDDENRVRKEKWGWAWDAQKRVEGRQSKLIEDRQKMLLEAPGVTGVREKFRIDAPKAPGLIKDIEENKEEENAESEDSDAKALVATGKRKAAEEPALDVMAPQKDTRSAGVDGWNFKARNSLMFSPDADVSPYHPPRKVADQEVDPNPKAVNYGSTRLLEYEHKAGDSKQSASAPPSPTRSRIDAAITGTPYHPHSSAKEDFSLIPNLPSPTPAELGPVALKQLMTWGTLNSTPRIISQSGDVPGSRTPFHIPDISAREAVSHKLANSASKSLRAKAEMFNPSTRTARSVRTPVLGKKGSMAPPSMTPRRSEAAGSLTPAARRLLERTTLGTAATRRADAMERTAGWTQNSTSKERDLNRVRWTPTPSPVTRK
ncbi:hypothetical protein D9619_003170 [Psilocybe cf. subviscida]|uniref:Nuclear protein DGCR14 n=1 Tax=Psilocybe cf. subviscida TaxID=2480587 RepID=A0A8H5EUM4_9AGAR|nr:hypothetical protein D9619_003170 [Psilocybe cf. subviscida]